MEEKHHKMAALEVFMKAVSLRPEPIGKRSPWVIIWLTDRQSNGVWLHSSLTAGPQLSSPWPWGFRGRKSRSADHQIYDDRREKTHWSGAAVEIMNETHHIMFSKYDSVILKVWREQGKSTFYFACFIMRTVGSFLCFTLKDKVTCQPHWQEQEQERRKYE